MIELIKVNDINFVGFSNDYLFNEIKNGNSFVDIFIKNVIDQYVKKDSVCLDIGANLGYVSIYLAKKCKKVYSFEPQHIVFLQLCANLFFNECWNAYPLELAAYSKECSFNFAKYQSGWVQTKNFDDYNKIGSIGSISLEPTMFGNMHGIRPDTIIKEKIDFIKVDAQGGDIDAIFGCEELIKVNRPVIVFEYERDLSIHNYNREFNDLVHFINQYKYTFRSLFEGNYVLEPI